MNKVLKKLESIKNRNAIFKTVICLILDGKEYFFEGSIEGIITNEKIGHNGFGYDPIFRPNNFNLTFAQMSVKEKSKIPISVSWEGGVQKWSGLLEVAMEGGYVSKPSPGWYAKVDRETGEISDSKVREKDTLTEEFWEPIITDEFKQYLTKKFKI